MADKFAVKAEKKENGNKNVNRRFRMEGKIPVVVYGGGTESVAAVADLKDLAAIIRSDAGVNTVFSLDIAGDVSDVIFQDRQIDALTGRLIHADLRRIAKGEKIELTIPIHLVGEAKALQESEGAVLSQAMRDIKVLVEPAKAPEAIEADVTDLEAGHSLHVSDLKIPAGIEVHGDMEAVVASIVIVKEVELEPQVAEEGEEPVLEGEEPTGDEGETPTETPTEGE